MFERIIKRLQKEINDCEKNIRKAKKCDISNERLDTVVLNNNKIITENTEAIKKLQL